MRVGRNSCLNIVVYLRDVFLQVLPAMIGVHGNAVEFVGGKRYPFDATVFTTGGMDLSS